MLFGIWNRIGKTINLSDNQCTNLPQWKTFSAVLTCDIAFSGCSLPLPLCRFAVSNRRLAGILAWSLFLRHIPHPSPFAFYGDGKTETQSYKDMVTLFQVVFIFPIQ